MAVEPLEMSHYSFLAVDDQGLLATSHSSSGFHVSRDRKVLSKGSGHVLFV